MPPNYSDEIRAARYDEDSAETFQPEMVELAVEFLGGLVASGSSLDLGIGTGRIAIPLARRGIRIYGTGLSEPMIHQLKAKPGAESIGVTVHDFVTTTVPGASDNTIENLTSEDA